ncbi:MAG: hypothetical protein R3247_17260, partial [Rhodothermales bacterium]|nr:hypothetical protein [Rhodothermales bacterium]
MTPRTASRAVPALALLLVLAAAPAAAQPAPPDDATVLADLERSLSDPGYRATLTTEQWHAYGESLE